MAKTGWLILLVISINHASCQMVVDDPQKRVDLPSSKLSQGEGVITINFYRGLEKVAFDTAILYHTYKYFIKGSKILQNNAGKPLEVKHIPKAEEKAKEHLRGKISTSATVTSVNLAYLMDLEKSETYTFYRKNGKAHVAVDSLSKYSREIFYRNLHHKYNRHLHDLNDETIDTIAGIPCRTAMLTTNGDTTYFKYTNVPLKLRSPLNYLIPESPNDVLAISIIPKTYAQSGTVHFTVSEIKTDKIPDSLLEISKGTIRTYNVPLEDILRGNNLMK